MHFFFWERGGAGVAGLFRRWSLKEKTEERAMDVIPI